MGSKNCPETPRQKMIGMMYLFLMAMLALNVSSEVLRGFELVDRSLNISIASTQDRINEMYHRFDLKLNSQPDHERLAEMHERAQVLRTASDTLFNYIQWFKVEMIRLADRRHTDPAAEIIRNPQDLNVAGQFALHHRHGEVLREKLIEYRDLLIELADHNAIKREMYETMFDVSDRRREDGTSLRWEQAMFDKMPLGAAVTILTKIQNDVRVAELDLVQFLERQVDAEDLRVDTFQAFAIPSARQLVAGSNYRLEVGLAAMASGNRPRFYYEDGRPMQTTPDGLMAIHTRNNVQVGTHTVRGRVVWVDNLGNEDSRNFTETFTVSAPSATISNVDLNVMYRGIDNRFSVSVPGIAAGDVRVTAEGASVRQAGAFWLISPNRDEDIRVTVTADGRTMGTQSFRVRQLPTPSAFLRYRDAGGVIREVQDARLSLTTLRSPDFRVVAGYGPDELIQADFEVVGFSVTTIAGNVRADGNRLTPRQLQDIERLDRGSIITFREIDARGPDGTVRRLGLLQVTLN